MTDRKSLKAEATEQHGKGHRSWSEIWRCGVCSPKPTLFVTACFVAVFVVAVLQTPSTSPMLRKHTPPPKYVPRIHVHQWSEKEGKYVTTIHEGWPTITEER